MFFWRPDFFCPAVVSHYITKLGGIRRNQKPCKTKNVRYIIVYKCRIYIYYVIHLSNIFFFNIHLDASSTFDSNIYGTLLVGICAYSIICDFTKVGEHVVDARGKEDWISIDGNGKKLVLNRDSRFATRPRITRSWLSYVCCNDPALISQKQSSIRFHAICSRRQYLQYSVFPD